MIKYRNLNAKDKVFVRSRDFKPFDYIDPRWTEMKAKAKESLKADSVVCLRVGGNVEDFLEENFGEYHAIRLHSGTMNTGKLNRVPVAFNSVRGQETFLWCRDKDLNKVEAAYLAWCSAQPVIRSSGEHYPPKSEHPLPPYYGTMTRSYNWH